MLLLLSNDVNIGGDYLYYETIVIIKLLLFLKKLSMFAMCLIVLSAF